jgi:lipopolysaccharide export system protein LptA
MWIRDVRFAMTCRRRRVLFAIGLLTAASIIGAPAFGQLELGGDHDANLPIEITADSLEVQQENQLAIFRGKVDAVQGEMNLRADVLVVHYRPREDNQNSISLIEVEGNVFVSSPDEMAQGDRGTYDVDAQIVELDGAVVLTQGENVIRGDHLVLNLATGQSKMASVASADGIKQRVKAIFVPESTPE